jgi:hypothetical protein
MLCSEPMLEPDRREFRLTCRLNVLWQRSKQSQSLHTQDVGFRGAFLQCEEPPGQRQLVKLTFSLPGGEFVETHAMVVHVRKAEEHHEGGFGVQFWGLDAQGRATWDHFVHGLMRDSKKHRKA